MRVVCQNAVSTFAVRFLKNLLKIGKNSRRTMEIIWEMEKMSYIEGLWGYQKKKMCVESVYILYKMRCKVPKDLSVCQRKTSQELVFRRRNQITSDNNDNNYSLQPTPKWNGRSFLSRCLTNAYRCFSVAHYCIEDCLAIVCEISICIGNLYWKGCQWSLQIQQMLNKLVRTCKELMVNVELDRYLSLGIRVSQLPYPSHRNLR